MQLIPQCSLLHSNFTTGNWLVVCTKFRLRVRNIDSCLLGFYGGHLPFVTFCLSHGNFVADLHVLYQWYLTIWFLVGFGQQGAPGGYLRARREWGWSLLSPGAHPEGQPQAACAPKTRFMALLEMAPSL